ncbi:MULTISPECIES: hypothetical protein [unclassified Tenacibaculum]|uniref:hypothetical protein n=1 Tax=unclassified Tenacibaculum TaxID=2635139 RepID=UPI001F1ACD9C|nr:MULTISPECIES: hypothetical protein [unclassified Tenacibaculum]MCF2875627.1 hypothetical protein [Tenacibaculum sp. Cn5-1]MCF2935703.1 hypothetical protein [Tenacibaculum sp. Cn5-34]MCG7512263.1 hypothetical protein [Tenacibaculum sp. Cn5-46]
MNLLLMILAAVVVAILLAFLIVKFVPLKMRWLISILLLAATAFLVYKIYGGIMEPINFAKDKKVKYAKVIENLKLIRDAEVKYKEVHKVYTDSKDSLINFIENGKLALTETKNVEEKVDRGGGIFITISKKQIDTIGYEPVSKYFEGKDYKEMFKVPGTDKEFQLAIGKVEKVAGLLVPVFEAKADKASILKGMSPSLVKQELEAIETDQIKGEFVSVGSLDEVTTGGNWPPYYDKAEALAKKE